MPQFRQNLCTTSGSITFPSSLILAHAPDQNPPGVFDFSLLPQVFAGCCQPLLEVGLSRRYLRNLYTGAWTLTPQCLSGAFTRFFPESIGLTLDLRRSAHQKLPVMQLQQGQSFRGCSHSFMFRLPCLLDPQIAPTAEKLPPRAAGPFTPRNGHAVTLHELWHRYMPKSGN